jgi:hypothetical protein
MKFTILVSTVIFFATNCFSIDIAFKIINRTSEVKTLEKIICETNTDLKVSNTIPNDPRKNQTTANSINHIIWPKGSISFNVTFKGSRQIYKNYPLLATDIITLNFDDNSKVTIDLKRALSVNNIDDLDAATLFISSSNNINTSATLIEWCKYAALEIELTL